MSSDNIVTLNPDNFDTEVLQAEVPVLVDFWAEWCAPCRMVAPVLEQIASEMEGKIRIGKLNVDDNQGLASQFQVASIPTFILFKNGQPADRMLGVLPKGAFEQFIDRNLA